MSKRKRSRKQRDKNTGDDSPTATGAPEEEDASSPDSAADNAGEPEDVSAVEAETEAPAGEGAEEPAAPASLLRQVEAERDKYRELSQRTRADLENYRKRVAREQAQLKRESLAGFLNQFLPAFDDLDRAVAEGEKSEDVQALLDGVRMVRQNLWKSMESAGVRRIEAEGERFDPALHEAMSMIPMPGKEPNTVVDVFQSGFMLDDFVLRPARVIVAAPPPEPAGGLETQDEES